MQILPTVCPAWCNRPVGALQAKGPWGFLGRLRLLPRTSAALAPAMNTTPRISPGEPCPGTGSWRLSPAAYGSAPSIWRRPKLRLTLHPANQSGEPCPQPAYGSVPCQGPQIVRWGSWAGNRRTPAFERSETSGRAGDFAGQDPGLCFQGP
jgi:hypothetical protein